MLALTVFHSFVVIASLAFEAGCERSGWDNNNNGNGPGRFSNGRSGHFGHNEHGGDSDGSGSGSGGGNDNDSDDQNKWQSWQSEHRRRYHDDHERQWRFNNFKGNARFIESHNGNHGKRYFNCSINHLADKNSTEYRRTMLGYRGGKTKTRLGSTAPATSSKNSSSSNAAHSVVSATALASSVDWRKSGAVSAVQDQGDCGCCWSYSATGALKGAYKIKKGSLKTLSKQNLMDCSWSYGNAACDGGWMVGAFEYARDKGGVNLESAYPFNGISSHTCRFSKTTAYAKVASYVELASGDENALAAAVAKGPVSVAIDASSEEFQFYSSCIYTDSSCSKTDLNHGVLIVGYGTASNGAKYWIVKNSWSTYWGENGYVRMARGSNTCGIATEASYPVLA